jgi:hypothetical protein
MKEATNGEPKIVTAEEWQQAHDQLRAEKEARCRTTPAAPTGSFR